VNYLTSQLSVCLIAVRPPFARANGKIQSELKSPFRNGTTHILFSTLYFLSKLAALAPRPRHNLVRYHNAFTRKLKLRKPIFPKSNKKVKENE
jgi:hypothetical protein